MGRFFSRSDSKSIARTAETSQRPALRFEHLETRTLLAADLAEIAGVVSIDTQTDGDTSNDLVAAGVPVSLYQDGGDGSFDGGTGDDRQVGSTDTTDAAGRYHFGGLGAGRYFVKVAPGEGLLARPGDDVHTIDISSEEADGSAGHTIDGFTTRQAVQAVPPLPSSDPSTLTDSDVLGGERDMLVELTDGDDEFTRVALLSGGGLLRLASDPTITGDAQIVWDGPDGDAGRIDPTGLGGLDLTESDGNTMTGIALTVGADHPDAKVKLRVYSDANNWSEYLAPVPQTIGGAATESVVFSFNQGTSSQNGQGADFTNVGAIELKFEGVSAADGQMTLIGLVGLTTKTAEFSLLESLSLGDTVWLETDEDGLHDPSEPGIAGVELNLIEDTNRDEVYTQGVDQLLATTETNSHGKYLFDDLFPGKYIVQVAPSNFQNGQPLAGLRSSISDSPETDPDDDVNRDDDGGQLGAQGVLSRAVMLMGRTEPTDDGDADANSNLTVDFGFSAFDLVIDKSVSETVITPGEQLTYTVEVTNTGPTTAEGVELTDTLPDGVTFLSGETDAGSRVVSIDGDVITADFGALAANATATATILVRVDSDAAGTLKNVAVVAAPNEDDTTNNMDMVTTEVAQRIDLAIDKSDSDDPVQPGGTFSYTLDVVNHGPSLATGVTVVDTLPVTGVSFQSASVVPSRVAGREIEFDLGDLEVGESTSLSITVLVDADFVGRLLNVADVTGNEPETNLTNNHDEEPTDVGFDIALDKSVSATSTEPGERLTYTIDITHAGPAPAHNVAFNDTLPNDVSFVSGSTDVPGVNLRHSAGIVTADFGTMETGASASITIIVDVKNSAEGTLINKAIVSAENEYNTSNNSDMVMTDVEPRIDLEIDKIDSHDPVEPGDTFSYTLTIKNNGPSRATGVTVVDTLPVDGIRFSSASLTPSDINGRDLEFDLGDLARGESDTVTIDVVVDSDFTGTLLNVAEVYANEAETNLANNRDEEPTQVNIEPASIGGTVYHDRDNDGVVDANEQRLAGVLVTLTGVDFRGAAVNLSMLTDPFGRYLFDNLAPGDYQLDEDQPRGYKDGKDTVGSDGIPASVDGFHKLDLNDTDDRDADGFQGIELVGGSEGTEYNFGELAIGVSKADFIIRVVYR